MRRLASRAALLADASDCDARSADSYPDATEICDSADNDCDGEVDEESIDPDGDDDRGDDDGCSCRAVGGRRTTGSALLLSLAFLFMAIARRAT